MVNLINNNILHQSKNEVLKKIKNIALFEHLFILSNGLISLIDVLQILINKTSATANSKLMISTWTLCANDILVISDLLKSRKISIKILLDVSFQNRHQKNFDLLMKTLGEYVWLTKNHSKIITLSDGFYNFVVLSSANLNRNFRLENYDITESKIFYNNINSNYSEFFKYPPIIKGRTSRPGINEEYKLMFENDSDDFFCDIDLGNFDL